MNMFEDIGIDHLLINLYLFRTVSQVKMFCEGYHLHPRHPSGLFIEETKRMFQKVNGEEKKEEYSDPFDWAISFMVHCADTIEE